MTTPRNDRSSGASAVEYALIVAGLSAALLLVMGGLQRGMTAAYTATAADISAPQVSQTPSAGNGGSGGSTNAPAGGSSSAPAGGSSSSSSSTPAGGSSSTPAGGSSSTPAGGSSSTPASTSSATPPAGAVTVAPGRSTTVLTLPNGTKDEDPDPSASPARGMVGWQNGALRFTASAGAPKGPVTLTYTVKANGKTTTSTVVVWIV